MLSTRQTVLCLSNNFHNLEIRTLVDRMCLITAHITPPLNWQNWEQAADPTKTGAKRYAVTGGYVTGNGKYVKVTKQTDINE